jgi:hypothetical protein
VGTQHVIEEVDLEALLAEGVTLPLPPEWQHTRSVRQMPNVVAAIAGSRRGR